MNQLIVPHMRQPWNSVATPSNPNNYVPISPKSVHQKQIPSNEEVWRPRKKQKRNKPTLSCEECVERKTKVGAAAFITLYLYLCRAIHPFSLYSTPISRTI